MPTVDLLVLGGGISGQMVKLLNGNAVVLEGQEKPRQTSFTRQFGANYLWKPVPIFETVSFPVVTHVDGKPGTQDSILRYKHKIGKPEDAGNWGLQFDTDTTGYDIVSYPEVDVRYGCEVKDVNLDQQEVTLATGEMLRYHTLVSTIPLAEFARVCPYVLRNYPVTTMFQSAPIYVVVTPRPPDAAYPERTLYVNYISNPLIDCYRFCDRSGERHYEGLNMMGRFPSRRLYPGKIKFHPEVKRLLTDLQSKYVYCFGRYGKWSPDELLHETFDDMEQWTIRYQN